MTTPTSEQLTISTEPVNTEKGKITLSTVEDFPPGDRRQVKVGSAIIAVFNINGEYRAIYGRCPHQFALLSQGRLQGTVICNEQTNWETEWAYEGEILTCPGHAMEFHVKTGEAIGYGFKLRTYKVVVEDGMLKLIL